MNELSGSVTYKDIQGGASDIIFLSLFKKNITAGDMVVLSTSREGSARKDPWSVFI